jgi:hypothetical protein
MSEPLLEKPKKIGVVRRDKREHSDMLWVEIDPNPGKNKKYAVIQVHEVGLGLRGVSDKK